MPWRPGDRRPRPRPVAQGSGFFISEDGYLVTNNHVVDGGQTFTVVTDDGKEFDAKLVGTDAKTDLACSRSITAASSPTSTSPMISRFASATGWSRSAIRRPRRHGDGRHRLGARPRHRRRSRMTTSSRSTRPVNTATPAGRRSTSTAKWSASTPPSSRRRAAMSASPSPYLPRPPGVVKDLMTRRHRAVAAGSACRSSLSTRTLPNCSAWTRHKGALVSEAQDMARARRPASRPAT